MVKAPWTDAQVEALNEYQTQGRFHPFTCGNDRHDAKHSLFAAEHNLEHGLLRATAEGWICPCCDYTQDWAHDFMMSKF